MGDQPFQRGASEEAPPPTRNAQPGVSRPTLTLASRGCEIGKSAPSPPAVPDPTVVAQAQSAANIATANNQAKLNQLGSSGPYGSVKWQADPSQPGGQTQVTTLSPAEQGLLTQVQGAGSTALHNAQSALNTPITSNVPLQTSYNNGVSGIQTSIAPGGQIQGGVSPTGQQLGVAGGGPIQSSISNPQAMYGFTPQGSIQGQVSNASTADQVNQAINAVYGQATSRLDPQFHTQQNALQQQLADQGVGYNSAAYQNAMDQFGRTRNDAYNQALYSAIGSGQNEQNTLYGQALNSGQFANSAQQQGYNEQQGLLTDYNAAAAQNFGQGQAQGQFANNAQLQNFNQNVTQGNFANTAANALYGQNLSSGQFGNAAQSQAYQQALAAGGFTNAADAQAAQQAQAAAQFQNQASQQALQQQAFVQQTPINEATALMSGAQVQGPSAANYTPTSVAPTDVLGAYSLAQAQANANYQAQMQQYNSGLGGLFNLGSAGILKFSDVRLKRDIKSEGSWKDYNVYSWRYVWDQVRHLGVMAQEVLKIKPEAVFTTPDGWLAVDYGKL